MCCLPSCPLHLRPRPLPTRPAADLPTRNPIVDGTFLPRRPVVPEAGPRTTNRRSIE